MGETSPEALLAEAAWLKRLALSLAGNEDDADDIVQESWIAAWGRRPDANRSLRPWLSKVARDLSKMRRRGESRRATREAVVAEELQSHEVPQPDALIEQVRLHRLLADLVLELEEPFRSTILARFVEGKTASAIAKAQSLPESTVRWRLREALARLRARLDETNGNRKAWAPAVLLFAQKGIIVAKPAKTVLVLVGLLLLLLVGALALHWKSGGADSVSQATAPSINKRVQPHRQRTTTDDVVAKLASDRPPGWLAQEGVKPRRIAGRVLVDGAPAGDALVRLASEVTLSGFVPRRERRTDADGRFDFGVQVATRYAVGAFVPGRIATVQQIDLREPDTHPDALVLVLDPCTTGFFGRVIDAAGAPIPNAELLAQDVIGAQTDRDGAFEICLDAAFGMQGRGDELRLVVRASGYGTLEVSATAAGRTRKDFVLSPEGVVTGRVVDEKGRAVAHAQVRFDWDEAAPRPGSELPATVRGVTDAEGRFEVAGLAAGRHRVAAFARGAGANSMAVQIGPGESKEITVTLEQRATIRGRVLLDGKPVGGVIISNRADNPSYQPIPQSVAPILEAVSQPDGTFVLDGISPGDVTFSTTPHRLRTPTIVHVTPGEQQLTFEVDALGEIAGTVRRHGKPVPHAAVFARGRHWLNHRWDNTDELGRFRIRGLDADEYAVHAASTTVGAFNSIDKRVPLLRGERKQIDIDLAYGARITGTVVDAKGAAVPSVFVTFTHTENGDLGRCSTDQLGRFECASMTGGGSYRARVYPHDGSTTALSFVGPDPAPLTLADGDSSVDGIRLAVEAPRLAIHGDVVDGSGSPVADARVAALTGLDHWSSAPTTVTNLNGEFELRDLAAGSYSLQVLGTNSVKTTVEGVAAGTKSVRIVLETPTCNASASRTLPETTGRPAARIVWDERIELVGWDVPARVRVGEEFTVSLVYRVLQPIGRSWKTLVHLDGPQARVNFDHEPVDGRCPTSTWQPNDIVVDRFTMKIGQRAGTYQLWTGFFTGWEPTWKNMSVTQAPKDIRDPNERVRIATIIAE